MDCSIMKESNLDKSVLVTEFIRKCFSTDYNQYGDGPEWQLLYFDIEFTYFIDYFEVPIVEFFLMQRVKV